MISISQNSSQSTLDHIRSLQSMLENIEFLTDKITDRRHIMTVDGPKEMIDWGRVRMPEIIIECDNVIITKIDDENLSNQNDLSLLSCKSNKDDTDSGIHESNYILVTGLHSNIHSNRRSLREMKRKSPKFSEIRSYSTNNLTETLPRFLDEFEIVNQTLCRNCSMKANGRKDREKLVVLENRAEIKKDPDTPGIVTAQISFQQRVCRISILLVCMKILLGSTMTGLGLFLWSLSVSITIKDCAFWASGPLLLSGVIDIYYCMSSRVSKRQRKTNYSITATCGVISLICAVISLLSSIFSGMHGHWITRHSDNCKLEDNSKARDVWSACCYTNSSNCYCFEPSEIFDNRSMRVYDDLTCRYLFSAVKDYLILMCALMAIGAGVSLWWVQIMFQRIMKRCSTMRPVLDEEEEEEKNCVRQSPVVPLKLRCKAMSGRSSQFSDIKGTNSINPDRIICSNDSKYSN